VISAAVAHWIYKKVRAHKAEIRSKRKQEDKKDDRDRKKSNEYGHDQKQDGQPQKGTEEYSPVAAREGDDRPQATAVVPVPLQPPALKQENAPQLVIARAEASHA
jgi:hypothetical protein